MTFSSPAPSWRTIIGVNERSDLRLSGPCLGLGVKACVEEGDARANPGHRRTYTNQIGPFFHLSTLLFFVHGERCVVDRLFDPRIDETDVESPFLYGNRILNLARQLKRSAVI
jgi:hypothetical protein